MNNLYIENLKVKFYQRASDVNHYAEQKDINRNHVNYGSATTLAGILSEFGCRSSIQTETEGIYTI